MSKYSTQLRILIDEINEKYKSNKTSISDKIEFARPYIFDFEYDLYEKAYKKEFETKILRHFYTMEIGFENDVIWKFMLENKIKEIMPEINQLWKSYNLDYNILENYKIVETINRDNTTNMTSEINSTDNSNNQTTAKFYDTPQSQINTIGDFLTSQNENLVKNDNTSNTKNKQNGTGNEKVNRTSSGNTGVSPARLIEEYRSAIINIDMIVISRLNELFMLLW